MKRRHIIAIAFSVLVLGGLSAGGGVGYAAHLLSSSAVSVKAHVAKLATTHAPSIRRDSAAIAQYGAPPPPSCPKCNQTMAATDHLIAETRALADRITNPVAKAAVLNALALAAQLDTQVTALVHQAAATKNPVVRAHLLHAAEVSANAAKALAALAHSFAMATLKAEGKQP